MAFWKQQSVLAKTLCIRIGLLSAFLLTIGSGETAEPMPASDAQAADTPVFSREHIEFFERDIRPLLVTHCYECHSGQSRTIQANLRLDSRSALLMGGDSGPAVVPGQATASLLIEAVHYEAYEMPPKGKLAAAEIAKLERWVDLGAPWPVETTPADTVSESKPNAKFDLQQRKQEHWVWQPIGNPAIPTVQNTGWPLRDLDHFILARLEQAKLPPAPAVPRRPLLRRLAFDLIGLPPTPEQVAAFVQDESEDPIAVAKVVDQLLQSPHFGERWGRHWLDLVRYAESRGHEFDNDAQNAFQYRDYIIRALNADVSYDQLVREHLAGDLLAEPRLHPEAGFNESILGTGFWFLGEWVHSPVDIRKDEADRFDNMIDVFSKTFLGVTVACARCHDHKFDAISSRDYYALSGFLQSSDYRQVRFETIETNKQIAAKLVQLEAYHQKEIRVALGKAIHADSSWLHYARVAAALLTTNLEVDKELGAQIQKSAAEHGLDEKRLLAWYNTIVDLKVEGDQFQLPWPAPEVFVTADARSANSNSDGIVVDFGQIATENYLQDGFAFGAAPIRAGDLLLSPDSKTPLKLAEVGRARFDSFWSGLESYSERGIHSQGQVEKIRREGKTLRTPTFELHDGTIFCLITGSGHIVACVDSHRLVAGPLHGETVLEVKPTDNTQPRWVQMNLGRYVGHRLHLEFSPDATQQLEVFQVVAGSLPKKHAAFAQTVAGAVTALDLPTWLQTVQAQLETALTHWQQAAPATGAESAPPMLRSADLAVLQWLIQHLSLFATPTAPADVMLQNWTAQWQEQRSQLQGELQRRSRLAMAMLDGTGESEHLLIRGNVHNPGELVPRRFLEAIDGGAPLPIGKGSGRLLLAERVNDPNNPLTDRVLVNRVWHHLMGRGIVPTVDDFGVLGQPPTHPELLDHLTTWFRQQNRSIKALIRLIVSSQTYRMSGAVTEAGRLVDPNNLLWHHVSPKRLQGEALRDALLAISGQLDRTMYGESVPIHLTSFMDGRGRPGINGPIDGGKRRSIYVAIRRNFLSPFMLAFDAPVPFSTMGRRNVSNVPAQALILMNDPFVHQQARAWAERALQEVPNDPAGRINWMYETAFARQPTPAELAAALAFVQQQAADRNLSPQAGELWTDFAHILINLKEFLFLR